MEEITEGVADMGVYDTHKKNRIQVSNTKKPLFFYVNLAKRYMQQHEEVELSALGMAIATVVTVAEILKNNGLAIEKRILTSTVDMKDETRGRPIQKAKVEIILEKSEHFDELMAAAAEERELAPEDDQPIAIPISNDSEEAGYIGLKNQAATCSLNSLLQSLYHIPFFRKAVYKMPRSEKDARSIKVSFALQSLFYEMQYSDTIMTTEDLTASLGWDTRETFIHQDIHEQMVLLRGLLQDAMEGTAVEGTIESLFRGLYETYHECTNVEYKSSQSFTFLDWHLDVKGCKNVYESFDKCVQFEEMKGENRYRAGNYGLQDANRRDLFTKFPPVLVLHLKRFSHDSIGGSKINDRYEFPLQLDLDIDNGKYLSPDADRSVRNLYSLHSVLVHRGDYSSGHYYAFIRPTLRGTWYEFDDEYVLMAETKRAVEDQYGGEKELSPENPGHYPTQSMKDSSAYMLVYIRDTDKERVMCPVDVKDMVEHLQIWFKEDQVEKEKEMECDTFLPEIAPDFTGRSHVENWIEEDVIDVSSDVLPDLVAAASDPFIQSPLTREQTTLIAEELKILLRENIARRQLAQELTQEERQMEREREEIRTGEEEARRTRAQQEWQRKAKKEEEDRALLKIRQKLEEDKAERRRKYSFPPAEPKAAEAATPPQTLPQAVKKPFVPASKKTQMRECLRGLKQGHKDEDARVNRAFQTILTCIENAARHPNEEKYRKIRLTNVTFQEKVGSLRGGVEFLQHCGFERDEGEFLILPREKVDAMLLDAAISELNSAINNPFFGVL